jgi:hypothetical protein
VQQPKDSKHLSSLMNLTDEQRVNYLLEEVIKNRKIWILTDDDGCVMLNTEDDDCVPVWPSQETAELWVNEEWNHCKAESISLNKWFSRWTQGLLDDELAVVVFPDINEQGVVLYSDELEKDLRQIAKKLNVKL